ncbi:helix-turn-helix domain-containing protein [Leucobacter sp. GX24907]
MTSYSLGARVRAFRAEHGFSLSELARLAGIGKGTLSEIESGKRNPTVETLYALCTPLGVPLSAIVGDAPGASSVSQGGITTTLLSVRRDPEHTVEVFLLDVPAGGSHVSAGHGAGVTEHLFVTRGKLRLGPVGSTEEIAAGESLTWSSAGEHGYASDLGGEGVLTIVTPHVL